MYLDYNVSSGPFLSFEIEIGDGPGLELDNYSFQQKCQSLVSCIERDSRTYKISDPINFSIAIFQLTSSKSYFYNLLGRWSEQAENGLQSRSSENGKTAVWH